ncbi:PEST proteolytic signal-containing nuclear protein-like isoform X2 [Corticium candelabrum]|uniref:PEST proteolytic signal-containing nuclear protein-like isoform X2 n=1 Tax=Corticium candelabrum TaxID=121492 RepID=UPI002E27055E|nr:PEST proteolytic signal-containing nuclear protein-like isoform X2 [Corticium candelabrum]
MAQVERNCSDAAAGGKSPGKDVEEGRTRKRPSECLKEEGGDAKVVSEKGFEKSEGTETNTSSSVKTNTIKTQFSKKKTIETEIKPKLGAVAKAFGDSDSDDDEEMPAEAKQRMRNIGKATPTSSGPRSFNKGKSGFSSSLGEWSTSQRLVIGRNKPDTKP